MTVYCEQGTQLDSSAQIYEKRLPIFGIVDPVKSKKVIQTGQSQGDSFMSRLASLFFGHISSESNLLPKEPTIVYYEDSKAKNRILTYQFAIRNLNYFGRPNLLNNILKVFCY